MARSQFTFTFRNAEPGAQVTFSAAVYASKTAQAAVGPTLVLDNSLTVAVWSDATELTATWVDGTGASIAAEASLAIPVVVETGGTLGTGPDQSDAASIAAKAQKITRTAVKTGNYTAAAGDMVPCDTTSAAFTVTLPNAPAVGSRVVVKIVTLGAGHFVTIACGGSDVFNKSAGGTTATLQLLGHAMNLQYDTGGIWTVVADDVPLTALNGSYPPRSNWPVEIAAAAAVGGYDTRLNAYNVTADTFRRARAAVARARNGTGVCNVIVYGDSKAQGAGVAAPPYLNCWPRMLYDRLAQIAAGGSGTSFAFDDSWGAATGFQDTRVTLGGVWNTQTYGPFNHACKSSSTGGTITFYADDCDSFTIYTLTGAAGTWTTSVDGAGAVNHANDGGSGGHNTVVVPAGTRGKHTVVITAPTGAGLYVVGVQPTIGTAGFRVTNCSRSGLDVSDLDQSDGTGFLSMQTAFAFPVPDIAVVDLTLNAYQGQKVLANFLTHTTNIIVAAQAAGADVVLVATTPRNDAVAPYRPGTDLAIPLASYNEINYQLADTYGCVLLDMRGRWKDYPTSSVAPMSFYFDDLHPSAKGSSDYADALFNLLTVAPGAAPIQQRAVHIDCLGDLKSSVIGSPGVLTYAQNNARFAAQCVNNNTNSTLGDSFTFFEDNCYLIAGTYSLALRHWKGTGQGIRTVTLRAPDGTTINAGTIDAYNAGGGTASRDVLTGIVIPRDGRYEVTISVPTKNASATAYGLDVTAITLTKTA